MRHLLILGMHEVHQKFSKVCGLVSEFYMQGEGGIIYSWLFRDLPFWDYGLQTWEIECISSPFHTQKNGDTCLLPPLLLNQAHAL